MRYSNTLMLERNLNFGGVLIEGHPENAEKLRLTRGPQGLFQRGGFRATQSSAKLCSGGGTVTYVGPPGAGTAGTLERMDEGYRKKWQDRFQEAKRWHRALQTHRPDDQRRGDQP